MPCASCVAITIQGGQQLLLPEDPAGVTVLLHVSISHPLSKDVLPHQSARGRAAVLVEPFPPGAPVPANLTYRLKSFLTQLRGDVPDGLPIALDASRQAVEGLLPELAPYADVVVGSPRVARPGRRLWPLLETSDAADPSSHEQGGFEQWVVNCACRRARRAKCSFTRWWTRRNGR